MAALGQYLLAHNDFGALRSLVIGGEKEVRFRTREGAFQQPLAAICQAIAQGHAPNIEELEIKGWSRETASLMPLINILHDGKVAGLMRLKLVRCDCLHEGELPRFMNALHARTTPLRSLALH